MRLKSYQIKNYKSIKDTGVVEFSSKDNISVLAGQNESGKSSILRALRDYENKDFPEESRPYSATHIPMQEVTCEYSDIDMADFFPSFVEDFISENSILVDPAEKVLDVAKIARIKSFKITTKNTEKGQIVTSIDDVTFNIFKSAILSRRIISGEGEAITVELSQYASYSDSVDDNKKVADLFWSHTPKIVFFDDFCDLLPDKIFISDLADKNARNVKGYRAVRNLESILHVNFNVKNGDRDAIRKTKEEEENTKISVNFQEDWGQRIHDENEVKVKYDFQKRDGVGELGSYINFFVETMPGQLLSPKQRSKGLIWFLSLWMELRAQDGLNLVLLLDEPDQHLHVKAQVDMLKLVTKLAKLGNQVIYATHSPYLIDTENLTRINLITNDKIKGTTISSVLTTNIDSTKKIDALQPISDAIGMHTSLRPLGHRSILLEGISDFFYFTAMKELLGKIGDYVFIPGIGVRKIENLVSFCVGGGLQWLAIIDDDPKEGGRDSLKKFEEIKEHLFDGDEILTKKKIYTLSGIVGIENMFSFGDLKLVDQQISNDPDKTKAVGKRRKVLFAKTFLEKVKNKEIRKEDISKTTLSNFEKAFNFIDKNLTT